MMLPDTPALVAQDLTCIRNDRTLFSGLSFQLRQSQALLLEGRNGSGKTSLLHILCGTRRPEQGQVSWGGEDIGELGSQYHAALAYLGHKDGVKLVPLERSRHLTFDHVFVLGMNRGALPRSHAEEAWLGENEVGRLRDLVRSVREGKTWVPPSPGSKGKPSTSDSRRLERAVLLLVGRAVKNGPPRERTVASWIGNPYKKNREQT